MGSGNRLVCITSIRSNGVIWDWMGSNHMGLDWIDQQDWDISGQIRQYKNRWD